MPGRGGLLVGSLDQRRSLRRRRNGAGSGGAASAGATPGGATPGRATAGMATAGTPGSAGYREVYAALDLGTNNCRLLVARPVRDGFRVIDAFSRIVRLGEGLSNSGRLTEPAIARTLEALRICAGKMERRGVTQARAVATEACRRARNCEHFVARARQETGVALEIISNSEEASLGLYGCTPLLAAERPYAIIFDIGGGSTEVSWLRVRRNGKGNGRRNDKGGWPWLEPEILEWCSLPIGVVTLAERYGGYDISAAAYAAMIDEVAAALAPFEAAHELRRLVEQGAVQMLGTSGTVTTLSGIDKQLPRYDRSRVDGAYLAFETAGRLCRSIAAMSYRERREHPCIGVERADLVVAGCAILEAICRTWPVGRLRVADRGLREGILFGLIREGHGRRRARCGAARR